MYIVATFISDDTFSHLIDTNKLNEELKNEIENAIQKYANAGFEGYEYFSNVQDARVDKKDIFPVTIHGMINIYLE